MAKRKKKDIIRKLGIEWGNSAIFPIPKSKLINKIQDLPKKSKEIKQEIPVAEINTEQTNLKQFLAQYKSNELQELAKKIDSSVRLLDESIIGKKMGSNDYFTYYYGEKPKPFITFGLWTRKKELRIFLKDLKNQEIIGGNWEINPSPGGYANSESFKWKIVIKDKTDCERFINSIKEYLETLNL